MKMLEGICEFAFGCSSVLSCLGTDEAFVDQARCCSTSKYFLLVSLIALAKTLSVVPAVWPCKGADLYWKISLHTSGNYQIGHWGSDDSMVKSPPEADRSIATNRGPTFYIRGQPGDSSKEETKDHLTLYYDEQEWNSKDYWEYVYEKPNVFLNNGQSRHGWKCAFQCPNLPL